MTEVYLAGYYNEKMQFIFLAIFQDEIDAWHYVAFTTCQGSRVFGHLDLIVITMEVY
jgi:hypothetical protein